MAGNLIQAFRLTLARIADIERNIITEKLELATLRGEIEELRAALGTTAASDADSAAGLHEAATRKRPIREGSSVGLAKRVLQMAGGPMYVNEIIKNIEHMTGLPLNKPTLVSNLSRYVKAGDTFKRTGANTFALLSYEEPEAEIRLVG
jgi:hypothetical protein